MTADPLFAAANTQKPFSHGWEAQIFAAVVQLHRNGIFTWPEWTAKLSEASRSVNGDSKDFGPWVAALQSLLCEKRILTPDEVIARQQHAGHDH